MMNIKQAAATFNLTADTLRYYERVGIIPPIPRNQSGYRDYQTKDLNWVYLVTRLRAAGLSIESLIEFATLSQLRGQQPVETAQKQVVKDQLAELEIKLAEMQEVKNLLTYKIETYDEHIAQFESGELTAENQEALWQKNFKQQEQYNEKNSIK